MKKYTSLLIVTLTILLSNIGIAQNQTLTIKPSGTIANTNLTITFTNSIVPNGGLTGQDAAGSNIIHAIGKLRVTEGLFEDNVNLKPFIAFASLLNLMTTGQCNVVVIGDSMSGLSDGYNSISKNLIWQLENTYGFVGDYCMQPNQSGAGMYGNLQFTNYWFGIGACAAVTNDNGASQAGWSQGTAGGTAGRIITRNWPINQESLIYLTQPTGGSMTWFDNLTGDGRWFDNNPANYLETPSVSGLNISINTYSVSTNMMITNWPVGQQYVPGSSHGITYQAYLTTGTNIVIGAGFRNTNSTGICAYWLGDNGPIAPGQSTDLNEYLSPGTNLLHQFATIAQPDMIIYHAKDYLEPGAETWPKMESNLIVLLKWMSTTNTKVFVIGTPVDNNNSYYTSFTYTNNLALKYACYSNNWTYIPLAEKYSGQLYGTYPYQIGADPHLPLSGIIRDSVHPSDYGAWLMAWYINTHELYAPISVVPYSPYDGARIAYQPYPPTFNPNNNWGVATPSLTLQAACSKDVLPFVLMGGTTNIMDINALNMLCIRLRTNNLWPDGVTHTLALWPLVGNREQTARFNLIDPTINYMGITTPNNVAAANVTNGLAVYSQQGVQFLSPWIGGYATGWHPGVRETNGFSYGPANPYDSISNNMIFSYTNTCVLFGIKRINATVPPVESFFSLGGNATFNTMAINAGTLTFWYGNNSGNTTSYLPINGVFGMNATNATAILWENGTNILSVSSTPFPQADHESTFLQGADAYGANYSIYTNAIIYAVAYGCGYSSIQFTNLEAIIAQFGIDRTNNLNKSFIRM